ncbi:hypothetical protein JHFBIEKO_5647 [Methylobacterium mesophilicum]|nr:hypothetical protein JHFBIEKO_5647 [Methylobacterium mesophilicum]
MVVLLGYGQGRVRDPGSDHAARIGLFGGTNTVA